MDEFGFETREYRVVKYGVALRLKRSRIAARLYWSDKRVADVLRRWMQRALDRQEPSAVMGREVVAQVQDYDWHRDPRLLAYVRVIRDVHPDDREGVVPYIDTGTYVRVPVMKPLSATCSARL